MECARSGVWRPKGDDPNDVLLRDFALPELLGPEGRRQWQRYQELRRRLRSAPDAQKPALVKEAAGIASKYGFGA